MSIAPLPQATIHLRQVFEENAARPWLFVRPGGNWGDTLIYEGADKLAADHGLSWTTCTSETIAESPLTPDHCIYLHGGGGYNSWCTGRPFRNLKHAVSQNVHLVVQGPQSTEATHDSLREPFNAALATVRCERILFFARESVSGETMRKLELEDRGVELALDHDTALHLTAEDLCRLADIPRPPKGRYELTVSRSDNERPENDVPMPPRARGVVLDPAYVANSFRQWVRIHLYARSISTNRLHSAIVGSIAGKPVTLGPGSYHKNRSVWEFSLSGHGVEWRDDIPLGENKFVWLPRILRESYKFRQLRLLTRGVPTR